MTTDYFNQPACWWTANDGAVDSWTLTASTEATNHPVTEIQNESPSLTWRSTVGTSSWIEGSSLAGIDLGTLWGFVIINHNFDAVHSVDIQLQMWDATIGGNSLFNVVFPSRFPSGSLADMIPQYSRAIYNGPRSEAPPVVAKVKRWRLTFLATEDPISYYEVGRLFLGNPFQSTIAFGENECLFMAKDQTQVKRSQGKNSFKNIPPFSRNLEMAAPAIISNDDFLDWNNLIFVNGRGQNVFADPFPVIDENDVSGITSFQQNRNFFYQMYGTVTNSMKIGSAHENFRASGRIMMEENL